MSPQLAHNPKYRLLLSASVFLVLKGVLFNVAAIFEIAPNASAWYPPIGLSMAFALHAGWRAVPLLLIPADLLARGSVDEFSVIVVPQALAMGTAALALRKLNRGNIFEPPRAVVVFLLIAGLATTANFLLVTLTVQLITAQPVSVMDGLRFGFWLGDLSGVLLCTPVFLRIFDAINPKGNDPSTPFYEESRLFLIAILLAAAALATWYVAAPALSSPASSFFLLILPIAIAGLLWGFSSATMTAFFTNLGLVVLVKGTLAPSEVVDLQVFMLAAGATGLLVGALGTSRIAVSQELRTLAQRHALLASAITQTPIGIAVVEAAPADPQISFANPEFQALVPDIRKPDIWTATERQGGFEGDTEEGQRTLHWIVRPAAAAERNRMFVVLARDVTELRRQEATYRHRQQMAAIGELAGGIAHELNNLLHPILNLSKQARKDVARRPERLEKAFSIIEDSARNAAVIVKQVLTLARGDVAADSGCELNSTLRDATMLLRTTMPPTFSIEAIYSATPLHSSLSRTEFTQIITNLVINARDAAHEHGRVRLLLTGPVSGDAKLTVEDDGPGIPSHVAPHIFDPFYTSKPHGQGTGLGLAIVRDIILRRGGSVALLTHAPLGAQFVLTIPFSHVAGGQ